MSKKLRILNIIMICGLFSFSSCSNKREISFELVNSALDSYTESETYFLSTFTYKMNYYSTSKETTISGVYELDYDKNNFYLYNYVNIDGDVKERLIYKDETNSYIEYIHGKNITSSDNYVNTMNEARNVIKKYALFTINLENSDENNYYLNEDNSIELYINDDYFKVLSNGLISNLKIYDEELYTTTKVEILYSLKLNRRKSL